MEAEDEKKGAGTQARRSRRAAADRGRIFGVSRLTQVRSGRIPFYEAREKIKTYLETRRVEEARQQLVANLQRQRPVQRFAPDKTLAAVH
jgi:hypothetical protein